MKLAGKTDVGLVRQDNQDDYRAGQLPGDAAWALVCDGMGGENCGQIASSLAVRAFLDELHAVLRADMTTEQLREAVSFCVSKANAAVKRHAQEHTECHGMGTTLVSAVTNGSGAVICNVGDSRAYRVGAERLERITRDHSVVEGLIESGSITAEQARTHPNRNLITRALGPDETTLCDAFDVSFAHGDKILLCTDGLVVTATDEEMYEAVGRGDTPEESLEHLLELSKQRGAPDNVTAVLLYQE